MMASLDEVVDSPREWVAQHIRQYVATDGRSGHRWRGAPTLLLTTTGRRSGLLRRTALIYGRDGDCYVVVASNGGRARHPAWYLNLLDEPGVHVQVEGEMFAARARPASAEDKARLWPAMTQIWPEYDSYQAKTSRDIPVVIIEPRS